jgi:glycosyltransferase involved in cell wall biosynthesis
MKILVTAAQFASSISGLQRHALTLVDCLLRQPQVTEVHLVLAPWQQHLVDFMGPHRTNRTITHVAEMTRGLWSRNFWYYRRLPQLVERIQPDIVHLSYPVPIDRSSLGKPVVLTLHDLYPYDVPENFGFPKVLFNRAILQQCLESVDSIACVSDTTLFRLRHYASHRVREKALRIYNSVEPMRRCTEDSPIPGWDGEPFLLTVAQHRKNKNIPLLIDAFHRLLERSLIPNDTKLLIIGIPGPETHSIGRLIAKFGLSQRTVFLQGLSEAALQWCYRHCELLAAPSSIEGFGLPVAEALFVGCRVVCSDISAFREIAPQHCTLVSLGPNATENLVEGIVSALSRPHPGPTSLPQFSPHILGAEYVSLYQSLLPAYRPQAVQRETTGKSPPEGRYVRAASALTGDARK